MNDDKLCDICRINKHYMMHKVGLIICSNAVIFTLLMCVFIVVTNSKSLVFTLAINALWAYYFFGQARKHWSALTIPHPEELEHHDDHDDQNNQDNACQDIPRRV